MRLMPGTKKPLLAVRSERNRVRQRLNELYQDGAAPAHPASTVQAEAAALHQVAAEIEITFFLLENGSNRRQTLSMLHEALERLSRRAGELEGEPDAAGSFARFLQEQPAVALREYRLIQSALADT
jgi:hypothetical protein